MTGRGALFLVVVVLVIEMDAIGLALSKQHAREASPSAAWTALTGGVGLGGATGPAWSLFGVDPRLESSCEAELFPIPGLPCPDPTHGGGIAAYPPRR